MPLYLDIPVKMRTYFELVLMAEFGKLFFSVTIIGKA